MFWALAALAFGCGTRNESTSDAPPAAGTLRIQPAQIDVVVNNDTPASATFTATLVDPSGATTDVSTTTTFTLADSRFGAFAKNQASLHGNAVGEVTVVATHSNLVAEGKIVVRLVRQRVEPGAPSDCFARFASAAAVANNAAQLAYPADGVVLPPNLGPFEAHWRTTADLHVLALHNAYADVQLCLAASNDVVATLAPTYWLPLATHGSSFTWQVSSMAAATPTQKFISAERTVATSRDQAKGGLFYWSTTAQRVMRFDLSRPEVPVAPFVPVGASGECMGCHALSRDGKKMAGAFAGGNTHAAVMDSVSGQILTPSTFTFAAFTPNADKLVMVDNALRVVDAQTGAVLATAATTPNTIVTTPDVSFDGTQIAYVEAAAGDAPSPKFGAIVVRSFDNATNGFGPPRVLVPFVGGAANFYPSWSPDGKWILFTRTSEMGYDQASAKTFVVPADGSRPPVELAAANDTGELTNSWARWVPFANTHAQTGEPIYFVTFSSKRAFGVRLAAGVRPQIWMAAFFPNRVGTAQPVSAPAFWFPFQRFAEANHIAQWATEVPIE